MTLTVKDQVNSGEDNVIGEVQLDIGHGGQLMGWKTKRWTILHHPEHESAECTADTSHDILEKKNDG
eukprot:SAG31_NODE_28671_length_406_cov_1.560261_1_plen_66_part_10